MSYVSAKGSQNLATLAKEVLEGSRFAVPGQPANVRQAAAFATKELARRVHADLKHPSSERREQGKAWQALGYAQDDSEDVPGPVNPARIEADRKILYRLAYKWKDGERLQVGTWDRAFRLLACIKQGRVSVKIYNAKRQKAWHQSRYKGDWIRPASILEQRALLQEEPEADGVISKYQNRMWRALLPQGPLPPWFFAAMENFEVWAKSVGHDSKRIDFAIKRFLAPFCFSYRTGGIEPAWHDLAEANGKDTEQRRVVAAGLEVEKIWMGKKPSSAKVLI